MSNRPSIPNTSSFASSSNPTISGTFKLINGSEYGQISTNSSRDMIFRAGGGSSKLRTQGDLYLQYSSGGSWRDLYAGEIYAHDYLKIYDDDTQRGLIFGDGSGRLVVKPIGSSPYVYIWGDLEVKYSARKPGGGSWSSSSDARLKDVKKNFKRGIAALNEIKPVFYNYKKNNEHNLPSDKTYVGVIAQEVQKHIPEAVEEDSKGFLSVNNDPIIWTMLNAIKELKAENESMKKEIMKLKSSINH